MKLFEKIKTIGWWNGIFFIFCIIIIVTFWGDYKNYQESGQTWTLWGISNILTFIYAVWVMFSKLYRIPKMALESSFGEFRFKQPDGVESTEYYEKVIIPFMESLRNEKQLQDRSKVKFNIKSK